MQPENIATIGVITMRLIDADTLREYWLNGGSNENIYNTNDFLYEMDAAETIDPVHAAGGCYCKECKHFDANDGYGLCYLRWEGDEDKVAYVETNDFCSYGKMEAKK